MKEPTRRGRRPKDQKRIPLSMRITPSTREKLVAIAAENGRSITQEAEIRLEQALRDQRILDEAAELAFGRINSDLLMSLIGQIMKAADNVSGTLTPNIYHNVQRWIGNLPAFRAMVTTINSLFDHLEPADGTRRPQDDETFNYYEYFLLDEILRNANNEEWIQTRRERLGYMADTIESWLKTQKDRAAVLKASFQPDASNERTAHRDHIRRQATREETL